MELGVISFKNLTFSILNLVSTDDNLVKMEDNSDVLLVKRSVHIVNPKDSSKKPKT